MKIKLSTKEKRIIREEKLFIKFQKQALKNHIQKKSYRIQPKGTNPKYIKYMDRAKEKVLNLNLHMKNSKI